jgi:hypothetical protein
MSFRIGPPVKHVGTFKSKTQGSPTLSGDEIFDQLLPASWKTGKGDVTIHFPVSSMHVSLSHDLAQHKYWNAEAARVESTGRNSLEIEATIPFFNGIFPAKNEKWKVGRLYPETFRQLLGAFTNEKAGTLTHPELGEIYCRCVSFDFTHDANNRDGVQVTAKWIESRGEQHEDEPLIGEKAYPSMFVRIAAKNLDASKTDLLKDVPESEFPDESFTSLVNKITGFVDRTTSIQERLLATPGRIVAAAERLQTSLINATNPAKAALQHASHDQAERIEESARRIQASGQTPQRRAGSPGPALDPVRTRRPTARYLNKQQNVGLVTLFAIVKQLAPGSAMTMEDFISLNPNLVQFASVGPDTVVTYYTQ